MTGPLCISLSAVRKSEQKLKQEWDSTRPSKVANSDPLAGSWRHRIWLFRLALLSAPLLILLAVEGLLRLAGYGYNPHFFRSGRIEGKAVWTDNQDYGRRFFPPRLIRYPEPFTMPATKAPNTLRIFVLGESAAMGDPDPKFSLPRILQVLLRARFPSRRVEVINAAMVAINSHVILPIARDCAKQAGDVWVIYMGNNEVIGPFGSASIFGAQAPPLSLVRAGLWVKTMRLGQLLDAGLHVTRLGNQPLTEWRGMEMMAEQRVRHDASGTTRVYQHFENNLADILETGTHAGARIVLCTVATNLRDCAPFASLHRVGQAGTDLAEWQASYNAGVAAQERGDFNNAGQAYQRAASIDGEFADLAFRRAECYRRLGQDAEAAKWFREARDLDALQFRADGRINEIIRRSATMYGSRGVNLADAEAEIAAKSSSGIPGDEYFYEHVHLTPEGNYLVARAVAEQVVRTLGLEASGQWLTQSECFALLGLTEWNRYESLEIIYDRIQGAPFTNQVNHAREVQRIEEQLGRYRLAAKPAQVKREVQQVSKQVALDPDDPGLRWNLASLLELVGDASGAEAQWQALLHLQPDAPSPNYKLGNLLDGLGRLDEAYACYHKCLRIRPEYYDARYQLGVLCLRMEKYPEAIRHLNLVVQQKPRLVETRLALGQALARARRLTAAQREFEEVLRLDSTNAQAQAELNALH
jgi:tetratricopeptide (TPR) repeat protein